MTYSIVKNKDDQITCHFCKSICHKGVLDWWECRKCKVNFDKRENIIQFNSLMNDKIYTIALYLQRNESCLYLYHNINGFNLINRFDYLINITPETLQTKLKTYLLFL